MKIVFVNIMQELQRFDSMSYLTQPPVPLGILHGVTPKAMETALVDEQTERVHFEGDVFAFSVSTPNAKAVYDHADALRSAGKRAILGGIHVTVCPDEAARHADAIVTGEAETLWPEVCEDLLAGRLKERYLGSPTPANRMAPVDYRFFGRRRYLTPASLFATRGCNHRCSFCVSSRYMGPFRAKPLHVLETEIDQLGELYPRAFLQFSDDNLLANRAYATELLALLRRKQRRFVTMVTVDQFCDGALMEQMASSGCRGVAVGVESVDDSNCAAVSKYQNLQQPFTEAVRRANRLGIQTVALLMLGLPHDTPERLADTLGYLKSVPCSYFDLRILRIYPSTPLYGQMRAAGQVEENWWLDNDACNPGNRLLPSSLAVHFRHAHFDSLQLQRWALRYTVELNQMGGDAVSRIAGIGWRGRDLRFATLVLNARWRSAHQAQKQLALLPRSCPPSFSPYSCTISDTIASPAREMESVDARSKSPTASAKPVLPSPRVAVLDRRRDGYDSID
jgi:radical SAM superfamily enzyme YgiQ (UPF0313 family)